MPVRAKIRSKVDTLTIEELANTITHGFGLLLSIIGFAVLLFVAWFESQPIHFIGCTIYGLSLVILYAASTFYHSSTSQRKGQLQIADHCCIYLLIAGSYTPFGVLIGERTGSYGLLVAIWAFAFFGIAAKLILRTRFPIISVGSYVVMGWLGVFAIGPLLEILGVTAVGLIVTGGVAYTVGVVFFPIKRIRHHHAIFHVFILAGSIIHYVAVILYVVPAK
jgi:hemolysin III